MNGLLSQRQLVGRSHQPPGQDKTLETSQDLIDTITAEYMNVADYIQTSK